MCVVLMSILKVQTLSVHAYASTHLPIGPSAHPPTHPSSYPLIHPSIHLFFHVLFPCSLLLSSFISCYLISAGFVLFSLLVGTLIFAVNMNYVGYATTRVATSHAKHSIIEFVTGKYLSLQHCKVQWQWVDPQTVGKTVSFVIEVR